jgi:hypothetical protein
LIALYIPNQEHMNSLNKEVVKYYRFYIIIYLISKGAITIFQLVSEAFYQTLQMQGCINKSNDILLYIVDLLLKHTHWLYIYNKHIFFKLILFQMMLQN